YGVSIKPGSGYQAWDTVTFFSSESTGNQGPVLTVNYTLAPTNPVLVQPNGQEIWSGNKNITWLASSDPDPNHSLQYHIQKSMDGGLTWTDIVSLTGSGATSYTHNFTGSSSHALIRIRAYNGTAYSHFDVSNAPFTVIDNSSPFPP